MNWNFLLRKKKTLTPREAASKRRLHIFVLCLICSALFWLFTKLSQENQSDFQHYVIVQDFPEGQTGVNQSDSLVSYTLETSGLRLITERYFTHKDTLFFKAENLPTIQRKEQLTHYITEEDLSNTLREKYGDVAQLAQVKTDTIFIEAVPAVTKILPVYIHKDISYQKRFGLYGEIAVEPDSIAVTGPKTILDTLEVVRTVHWHQMNIRSTVRKTLDLDLPSVLLQAEESKVRLHLPVEEFTEASITLPIAIDCPLPLEEGQLRLFPSNVELTYLVALRDYRLVNENMFEVSITCPQADVDVSERLYVRLDKYPAFVEVLNIRPSSVDYVILE